MKRIISLLLVLAVAFCVCGCKKNGDATSSISDEVQYEHITIRQDENGSDVVTSGDSGTQTSDVSSANSKPFATTSSGSGNSTPATPVKIDYNTVVEVDICDDIIRGYLNADSPYQQYHFLSEYNGTKLDYQSLSLDWTLDGSSIYTVYFSENADFSSSNIVETKYTTIKESLCVPGKTYYWKVIGTHSTEPIGGGKIHIKDVPVRWLYIDGTANVRDMGGWKTESGKKVRYEMMYRGRNLDGVSSTGLNTIKKLGLKTEFDLRYANQKNQAAGTGMNYIFLDTSAQYDYILKDRYADEMRSNYKRIFEILSDKSNYPIYTHCSAGADRTGTFAFITNGLLGVSYADLTRDFELTSFSSSGKRWRGNGDGGTFSDSDLEMKVEGNYVAWGRLYKEMMSSKYNTDGNLSHTIQNYLVNYIGVPQSQIDSFKSIMLE